jgi:3-oxoacyl-[acyl-carrier-protein] synthase II
LSRRVVVTGVGMVSPVGLDTEATWEGIRTGRSGIGPITHFDPTDFSARIAGEVRGFDPLQFVDKKDSRKMGRFIHFAIAAADHAMASAGLKIDASFAERAGVYVGSGIGGFEIIEREHTIYKEKGPSRISPFFIPATIINLASGWVSIRTGAKGPNSAAVTACATGTHCIGDSFRLIQHGHADVMICGGTEAAITPLGVGGFAAMRALSQRNEAPEAASRPWDKNRDGFVVGEGAGVLILEELEFARARGARILAEIVGYGMTADAYHITSGSEDGDGVYRVMRLAMADAKLGPEQIAYINAHATSTDVGDRLEAIAVKRTFGAHACVSQGGKLVLSSTKSMTGHLLGGAGGLEAGITVMALRDQVAPPTMNHTEPDDELDLDVIPNKARPMAMEYALSNSFGFGGTNACLIMKHWA